MFTVKLMKAREHPAFETEPGEVRFSTSLIEADEVDIHHLRPGELVEVATRQFDGSRNMAYYIADRSKGRPAGFAEEMEFYYAAYIENAQGATTEVIRFPA